MAIVSGTVDQQLKDKLKAEADKFDIGESKMLKKILIQRYGKPKKKK